MHRRQPLPRLWLMTDERQGEGLWQALEQLPRGSGIIFRHYSLSAPDRRTLFQDVKRLARRRRLVLLAAGAPLLAADGVHGRRRGQNARLWSAPVHDLGEIRAAERAGADLLFLSPVFPTRSHPGAKPMGRMRFAWLARQTPLPVIALGGMNERRAWGLKGAYGWAAIDAWT
jgi:thiamine-phosphate pyrophosphorylase